MYIILALWVLSVILTTYRLRGVRGNLNLRSDGSDASVKTHIYRSSSGLWVEVEDMPTGRLNNYCGRVNTAQGKQEIKDDLNVYNIMQRMRLLQGTINALTTFN